MDLVQEVQCAVGSASVDDTLSGDGNVRLTFCEEETVVAFDHFIIIGIGRTDQDGTF